MTTKRCFKCKVVQPLDAFYRHRRMADGHLNKCIECTKLDVVSNYAVRREQYSEYDRERQQTAERKSSKRKHGANARRRHPEKVAARRAVRDALRSGRMIRPPCVVCGASKAQAHHHDYSQPLDIEWLCFRCHREREHGQVVTACST